MIMNKQRRHAQGNAGSILDGLKNTRHAMSMFFGEKVVTETYKNLSAIVQSLESHLVPLDGLSCKMIFEQKFKPLFEKLGANHVGPDKLPEICRGMLKKVNSREHANEIEREKYYEQLREETRQAQSPAKAQVRVILESLECYMDEIYNSISDEKNESFSCEVAENGSACCDAHKEKKQCEHAVASFQSLKVDTKAHEVAYAICQYPSQSGKSLAEKLMYVGKFTKQDSDDFIQWETRAIKSITGAMEKKLTDMGFRGGSSGYHAPQCIIEYFCKEEAVL